MTRKVDAKELLIAKALVPTKARLEILSLCMLSKLPMDAMDLTSKLGNSIHLATVYRTLEKLVSVGILERVNLQEGKYRYEFMHTHHHHAVCNGCGKVEDITESEVQIESVEHKLEHKTGFKVMRHTLELFGLCQGCQPKGSHVKRTS